MAGSLSGKADDAQSIAQCPANTILVSCSCYSPFDSCGDGAKPYANNCVAFNRLGGAGVYAQALCLITQ